MVNANSDSSFRRVPTGSSSLAVPLLATMAIVPSGSSRPIAVAWASRSRSTSSATAEKTSAGDTPVATSVATRRLDACSPASRLSSLSACRRSVTSNPLEHAFPLYGRRRPLDPPVRAVLADEPVLECKHRLAFGEAECLCLGLLAVVRVDELQVRSCKRLALGVTEARL